MSATDDLTPEQHAELHRAVEAAVKAAIESHYEMSPCAAYMFMVGVAYTYCAKQDFTMMHAAHELGRVMHDMRPEDFLQAPHTPGTPVH